jgi:2-phospho-L-lactate guanylyltransferase
MAAWLEPPGHRTLVQALCEDALELVAADREFHWWVVTDDAVVKSMARERGLGTMVDGGGGLNSALVHASEKVRRLGYHSVFILPSDLPLATATDLMKVSRVGEGSDVVLVVAEGSGGTNGLFTAPPGVLQPLFGPNSLRAHVDAATRLGLSCAVLVQPRLGLDLDTIEDVGQLLARMGDSTCRGRTHGVLARLCDSERFLINLDRGRVQAYLEGVSLSLPSPVTSSFPKA